MKFIKNNVYACTFTQFNKEIPAIFYGTYTHAKSSLRHFKYLSNVGYGTWHTDTFVFDLGIDITFVDLGTIKQNPELLI